MGVRAREWETGVDSETQDTWESGLGNGRQSMYWDTGVDSETQDTFWKIDPQIRREMHGHIL